jgi:hypothetical protein
MAYWVIKAGADGSDPLDLPEYLSEWNPSRLSTDPDRMAWNQEQRFAYRFADRNAAVSVALSFPICAYDDRVRIVKLRPKPKEPCPCPEAHEPGCRSVL